ncbi:MAG: hypothetical protein EOM20_17725 [Spartobacteria bacterium]|nr:hypothetical protein [Spartobacteria bacterium]
MIVNKFSLRDTAVLKAISIILIVLHNALHPIFRPIKVCNEFDFSISRIQFFWDTVSANFIALPNAILMTFGYTGVTFFFFLSAYGLAFKFNKDDEVPYWPFVKIRLKKLYTPILISTAFLLLFIFIIGQHGTLERFSIFHLFMQLATLINFTSSYSAVIIGPWWFLGAIIQLYLIFHILMFGTKKYGNSFLLGITILSFLIMILFSNTVSDYIFLKKNIIGWIPEVTLGIYFVRSKKIELSPFQATVLAIAMLSIYITGNIYEFFWYFSSFSILLFFVIISPPLLSIVRKSTYLDYFLNYTGKISVYMFLVNGIIREPIIALYVRPESSVLVQTMSALVILVLSFAVGAFLMFIQERLSIVFTRTATKAA